MNANVARTLRLPAMAWLQRRPRLSSEALIALDTERLRDQFHIHALLTAGAAVQVGLQRKNT